MSIFDKAKELVEQLVGKVRDLFGGSPDSTDADTTATAAMEADPNDDAVTPTDVAEAVDDPELPHPDRENG